MVGLEGLVATSTSLPWKVSPSRRVNRNTTMPSIFFSYARGDDGEPFDPATSFVARRHRDLTARGFEVWFDRMAMPSRALTFHQDLQGENKGDAALCSQASPFLGDKNAGLNL